MIPASLLVLSYTLFYNVSIYRQEKIWLDEEREPYLRSMDIYLFLMYICHIEDTYEEANPIISPS